LFRQFETQKLESNIFSVRRFFLVVFSAGIALFAAAVAFSSGHDRTSILLGIVSGVIVLVGARPSVLDIRIDRSKR